MTMRSGTHNSRHGAFTARFTGIALLLGGAAGAGTKEWHFRVYLDDRDIGFHHFQLTENDTATRLVSKAELEVTFLLIPVFTYRHDNLEHWNGECLESISSVTDENGELYRVNGNAVADGFRVTGATGETVLPACISTFAYWDRAFLQHTNLLNSQTGEYIDVRVDYLGERQLAAGGTTLPAQSYLVETDDVELEVWYSQEGHWLALQSTVDGGRLLRYVIEQAP
jgi:hypothetical protein